MSALPSKKKELDTVETMIRKNGDQWAKNWNSKQLDKVVAAYAEDAVYLPPHHAAVHGSEAIRAYLDGPIREIKDLHFDVTYIKHLGELAYDVGSYTMTVPHNAGTHKDQGKYLTVWRKEKNGEWKIVADSWSSDLPPLR